MYGRSGEHVELKEYSCQLPYCKRRAVDYCTSILTPLDRCVTGM